MSVNWQDELKYSDVTPRSVYINRRKFLQGMTLAGTAAVAGARILDLLSPAQSVYAGTKLNISSKSPFSTTEPQTPYNDVTHLQQFLRIRHGQRRSGAKCQEFPHVAVDGLRRRRSEEAAQVHDGRNSEACAARRAHLPAPLRRGVVDRGAVDRLSRSARLQSWSSRRRKRNIVAFESYYDPKQMPLGRWAGIDFPYVEGLRLDEAMNPLALLTVGMYGETLAESGWRAGAHGAAVEVRLQEHQVAGENPLRGDAAADHLEYCLRGMNTASIPT